MDNSLSGRISQHIEKLYNGPATKEIMKEFEKELIHTIKFIMSEKIEYYGADVWVHNSMFITTEQLLKKSRK